MSDSMASNPDFISAKELYERCPSLPDYLQSLSEEDLKARIYELSHDFQSSNPDDVVSATEILQDIVKLPHAPLKDTINWLVRVIKKDSSEANRMRAFSMLQEISQLP